MEIFDAIYRRRAVRDYTTQAVARETLDRLIDAAIQAPSAVNRQPWIFTVVQDQDLLDRISVKAKTLMLASTPSGGAGEHFRTLLSDPAYQIFYHAPALIVISGEPDERWVVEDCSLAAQNLMLAACAMGLGTCWIGFAEDYLQSPEGKRAIQLDAGVRPVAPIIVGYPKTLPPPVARKPARVHWGPSLSPRNRLFSDVAGFEKYPLLVPERFERIEARGFAGGKNSENDADQHRDGECDRHRYFRKDKGDVDQARHAIAAGKSEAKPCDATYRR